MARVIDLQRADDPRDIVHRAVQAIAEHECIALPSETVYGLAASALSVAAVEQMMQLKRCDGSARHGGCSIAIAVKSADEVLDYICDDSMLALRLARRCWPGPVTLMVPCDKARSAASRFPTGVRELLIDRDGYVSFRVVAHRLFENMLKYCAGPIALTGASRAGKSPALTGAKVAEEFGDEVSLIVDDGPTRFGGPSTVVRINQERYRIIREGVVETAAVRGYARPSILVVCTGNTCRSPMAEVLLKKHLEEHFAGQPSGTILPSVASVGLAAMPGDPASPQSVEVMSERGLDLSDHQSQPLGEQALQSADLVLTMTRSHRDGILMRWPDASDRVFTLRRDGGDISDPVGSPVEIYKACADQIDRELAAWVAELGPHWTVSPDTDDGDAE